MYMFTYSEGAMQTISATEARSRLFELLKASLNKNESFRIPYKGGSSILLAEEDYESLLETAHLLSAPGFIKLYRKAKKEIKAGKTQNMDKVFSRR